MVQLHLIFSYFNWNNIQSNGFCALHDSTVANLRHYNRHYDSVISFVHSIVHQKKIF